MRQVAGVQEGLIVRVRRPQPHRASRPRPQQNGVQRHGIFSDVRSKRAAPYLRGKSIGSMVVHDMKKLRRALGLVDPEHYLTEESSTVLEASAAVKFLSTLPTRPVVAE